MRRRTPKERHEEAQRKAREAREAESEAAKAVRAEERRKRDQLEKLLGGYMRRRLAGNDDAVRRRKKQIADELGPVIVRRNDRAILADFLGTEPAPYDEAAAKQYGKGIVPSGKAGEASTTDADETG